MRLSELIKRCEVGGVKEVIIATAATVEGDATALYIARLLQDFNIQVTRPAQGVPKGGEMEYLDDVTLSRAFAGRISLGHN
jgi:recombination protein RecR